MKDNIVNVLKNRCEESIKNIKKASIGIIGHCEQIISVCNDRKNMFGALRDEKARTETIDLCFKSLQSINELSKNALDSVLAIYSSIMRLNELGSIPRYEINPGYSSIDAITYSYFFTLANEIGNVFEDIFESDVHKSLNGIVEGLDLDNNGACINMSLIIKNSKNNI